MSPDRKRWLVNILYKLCIQELLKGHNYGRKHVILSHCSHNCFCLFTFLPSVTLSICLNLSFCLFLCPPTGLFICLFVYSSIYFCLSVHLSGYVYLFIHLSDCSSISLFIHLFEDSFYSHVNYSLICCPSSDRHHTVLC